MSLYFFEFLIINLVTCPIYSCTVHCNSSHLSNEVSWNVTEVAVLYGNVFKSVLKGSEKLLIVFSPMNKDPAVILSYFIIKIWFLPMVEVNSIGNKLRLLKKKVCMTSYPTFSPSI
jgi:hypothetical protein